MKLVEINNYWLERFWMLEEDYPTCFVCGKDKYLERCHLIPKALGGSNNADNLVLLCNEHHMQAPNTSLSKEIMLEWIEDEAEKYSHLLHMKIDDVQKLHMSIIKIQSRIENIIGKDFKEQDLIDFIKSMFKSNCISIGSHSEANIRTRVKFFEYMSEYKDLEIDYLKYLLSKNKTA